MKLCDCIHNYNVNWLTFRGLASGTVTQYVYMWWQNPLMYEKAEFRAVVMHDIDRFYAQLQYF